MYIQLYEKGKPTLLKHKTSITSDKVLLACKICCSKNDVAIYGIP